jgi:hypothetical protein
MRLAYERKPNLGNVANPKPDQPRRPLHQKKGFPSHLTLPIDADGIERDGKIKGSAFTPSPFSPTYFLGLGSSAGLM